MTTDLFKDPQMIQLLVLSAAFVVGIAVCIYVVVKETMELKKRRVAKRLMYADEVGQHVKRRRSEQLRRETERQELQPSNDSLAFTSQ